MTEAAQFFAGVEWPTVALLAGIVLWEELRKVPEGATLFRALLFRPFEPVAVPAGRRVVGLWPPFTTSFIVFPRPGDGGQGTGDGKGGTGHGGRGTGATLTLAERYQEVGRWFVLFRVLGALALFLIVLGVPLAAAWLGGAGLIGALVLTFLNSALIALLGYRAAGRAGVPAQMRRVPFLSLLSPFAAPRVGEVLLELIVREESAVAVAALVLEPAGFRAWVRPRAYDAQHGRGPDPDLEAVVPVDEQQAIVAAVPDGAVPGEGYCPRCGATYQASTGACSACEVRLVAVT